MYKGLQAKLYPLFIYFQNLHDCLSCILILGSSQQSIKTKIKAKPSFLQAPDQTTSQLNTHPSRISGGDNQLFMVFQKCNKVRILQILGTAKSSFLIDRASLLWAKAYVLMHVLILTYLILARMKELS